MERVTSVLVDMEVLDSRETGGHSPNMEREGLTRLLLRLMTEIDISEVVTDASSSIMKRIKEIQGMSHFLILLFFITHTFLTEMAMITTTKSPMEICDSFSLHRGLNFTR